MKQITNLKIKLIFAIQHNFYKFYQLNWPIPKNIEYSTDIVNKRTNVQFFIFFIIFHIIFHNPVANF